MTKKELVSATMEVAKAVFAMRSNTENFNLPSEVLWPLTDMLNVNSPLKAYTQVRIAGNGAGSVGVQYERPNEDWQSVSSKGSDPTGGEDVIIPNEVFLWTKSVTKEESISGADLNRGVPDVLAQRLANSMIHFLKNSVDMSFKQLLSETATGKGDVFTIPSALDISSGDKLTQFKIQLTQSLTKFCIDNELDPSDITVTLAPDIFDAFAAYGKIQVYESLEFIGGNFSIGDMSGYIVQSGGLFFPKTAGGKEVYAYAGTERVAIHSVDVTAANVGKLGLSNDRGMYLEMSDVFGAMDYKGKIDKAQSMVLTEA